MAIINFFITILFIAILIYITKVESDYKRVKGKEGEDEAASYLSNLNKTHYRVINDIMIKTEYGTSQIDHIVVSKYEIFVIETKNYGGTIYGKRYDENWVQQIGKKKNQFYNPMKQNYGHIRQLMRILEVDDISLFVSIIAFSKRAKLNADEQSGGRVIYINDLKVCIEEYNNVKISNYDIERYYNRIKKRDIKSKIVARRHKKNINAIQKRKRKAFGIN